MTDSPTPSLDERAKRLRMSATRLARLLRENDGDGYGASFAAALATVAKHGPITVDDLARRECVDADVASALAEALVAAGMAVVGPDGVSPTADAPAHLAATRKRRNDWLAGRLATLPDADLAVLDAAVAVLFRVNAGDD